MADELDALHTRRGILQAAGTLGMGLVGTTRLASAAQSVQAANSPQAHGASSTDPDLTTADILIETLIRWDVQFVFGIVGDGINSIIEALRKRQDRIRFIAVRSSCPSRSSFSRTTASLRCCSNRRSSAIPPTAASWRRSISSRSRKRAAPMALDALTASEVRMCFASRRWTPRCQMRRRCW